MNHSFTAERSAPNLEQESARYRPQSGRYKPAKSPATQIVSKDIAAYHAYVEVRAAVVGGGDDDREGVRPNRRAVILRLRLVATAEKRRGVQSLQKRATTRWEQTSTWGCLTYLSRFYACRGSVLSYALFGFATTLKEGSSAKPLRSRVIDVSAI